MRIRLETCGVCAFSCNAGTSPSMKGSGSEAALACETNYFLSQNFRWVRDICGDVVRNQSEQKHSMSHYLVNEKNIYIIK